MADIARLGFSADTGALKDAKASLDALVPSATNAASATEKFNAAATGVTTGSRGATAGIKSFASAAQGASSGASNLGKNLLMSGTAMGTVQRAAVGASAQMGNLYTATVRTGTGFQQADAHIEAYKQSLLSVAPAAQQASSSLDRLGAAANDNINRLQSTPGNIAAQFQDIGVTAAGGMNPLLIALQQGTQLSSAMAGGLGNVIDGFRQLFSVTTILTVGLVGLVAAGLQMIDWMEVGRSALFLLADALEQFGVAAVYAGGVLALAFSPKIIAAIYTTTIAIGKGLIAALVSATKAMIAFSLANPFGALIIAIGATIAAMWALNDTFGGVFTNILTWLKTVANRIIGAFVGAYKTVVAVWSDLPSVLGDIAFQAVDKVKRELNSLAVLKNDSGEVVASLFEFQTSGGNPYAGSASKAAKTASGIFAAEFKKDFVGQGAEMLGGFFGGLAGDIRGFASGLGADATKASGRSGGSGASAQLSEAQKAQKAYDDLIASTRARITELQNETKALDMSANAALLFTNQNELMNKAIETGVPITQALKDQLMSLATELTNAQIDLEFRKITKAAEEQLEALKQQAQLIGLSGEELTYNKVRQELLNDAIKAGVIDLNNMTDAMRMQIGVLGDRAAAIAAQTAQNDRSEFMSGVMKSYDREIDALSQQQKELGLTGEALESYRYQQELLNDAKRQGIELGPEEIDIIKRQGDELAKIAAGIQRMRDQIALSRSTLRGFFGDMFNGLQQGKTLWQAFGDAVMNVVNKIIDRLLDLATDQLINQLFNAVGAAAAGGAGGGSHSGGQGGPGGPGTKNALGNAFDSGGVTAFAKGGAFTNGMYNSPTLFKFAKGAAMGVMGEAGPEAVMPLKRGSDGSLGVMVQATEPQRVYVQIDTNDERFDAYVDDRVVGASPAIVEAGNAAADRTNAFRQSRRIG